MPRAGAEPLDYPASKPVFPELVKELADDARLWLDAEFALAKAEAGLRLRGYAVGVIVALLGVSLFIAATVVLAQAIVSALMPYVSQAVAGFAVGVILLAVVMVLGFTARHLLLRKTPSSGLIFRWLMGGSHESNAK